MDTLQLVKLKCDTLNLDEYELMSVFMPMQRLCLSVCMCAHTFGNVHVCVTVCMYLGRCVCVRERENTL